MQLAWLTDIHLNFLQAEQRQVFYADIQAKKCDAILISGDIAEAPSVKELLSEMVDRLQLPIYFVLGNHDYYRSTISDVKKAMQQLSQDNQYLHYLPSVGIQRLTENVCLVGQDGWADGRYGDYFNSRVNLMDSRMITDLFQQKTLGRDHLLTAMQTLADQDAAQLKCDLQKAMEVKPEKIIIVTHVPPFKECCLYEGKVSGDDFLPYFSAKATGEVLSEFATQHPDIECLVLAGHTHHRADYQALANLRVKVGNAEYQQPEVQEVIMI